jgi:hypothetical protein
LLSNGQLVQSIYLPWCLAAAAVLQMLVAVLEHTPSSAELVDVQEQLVGFTIAAGLVARLASVFSLFDQPMQQAARPVPPHVLQVYNAVTVRGLSTNSCIVVHMRQHYTDALKQSVLFVLCADRIVFESSVTSISAHL